MNNINTYRKYGKKYYDKQKFSGNRIKALERDGYKCVKCGLTNEDHLILYGYEITVDHIDGNGVYKPSEKRNNSLENLQTLCSNCHGLKDVKQERPVWQTDLQGNKIRWFRSMREVNRELKIHNSCVSNVIHGRQHTAGGYKWIYA